jgi:hypothetical protein
VSIPGWAPKPPWAWEGLKLPENNTKTCFISNTGNRDITLEGLLPVTSREQNFRNITKDVLNNLSEYRNNLSLPIIEKIISLILLQEKQIDKVVLFKSDQQDERFNHSDTIYAADIITEILKIKFPQKNIDGINFQPVPQSKKNIEKVSIQYSPNDFDSMMSFYSEIFRNKTAFFNDIDKIYISVVSGTQAMNMALILNSLEYFGNKVNFLYTSELDKKAHLLNLNEIILSKTKRKEFKALIKKYQYFSAQLILNDLFLEEKNSVIITALTEYAYNRLIFNFELAGKVLHEAITKTTGRNKTLLLEFQNQVCDLKLEEKLKELIYNAQIKLINGEYADFLGRIFNFCENIGKLILEKRLNFTINENDSVSSEIWKKYPFLQVKLNEKYKGEFDPRRQLNRDYCLKILEIFNEKEDYCFDVEIAIINEISKLAQLRNHSIIAHKFKGISRQDLEAEYGADVNTIFENDLIKLYKLACNTENELFENPYDVLNALIIENLE